MEREKSETEGESVSTTCCRNVSKGERSFDSGMNQSKRMRGESKVGRCGRSGSRFEVCQGLVGMDGGVAIIASPVPGIGMWFWR